MQISIIKYTCYNLFAGDKIYANGALVVKKDIHATNGVVHKLSKFLTPADLYDIIHFRETYGSNSNHTYSQSAIG